MDIFLNLNDLPNSFSSSISFFSHCREFFYTIYVYIDICIYISKFKMFGNGQTNTGRTKSTLLPTKTTIQSSTFYVWMWIHAIVCIIVLIFTILHLFPCFCWCWWIFLHSYCVCDGVGLERCKQVIEFHTKYTHTPLKVVVPASIALVNFQLNVTNLKNSHVQWI